MTPLAAPAPSEWTRSRRSRIVSICAAIAIEILLILALLDPFDISPEPRTPSGSVTVINLPAGKTAPNKAAQQPEKTRAEVPREKPVPPKPKVDVTPTQPVPTPNFIPLTREEFAASDIGKLPRRPAGGSGASTAGVGEGPGGATLYPAEWYRRPRKGVLADYLPYGAPEGSWAMIACRTVENYHVDECVSISESHVGLAMALRKAAWQFQVLPPRVNGRPQIGTWVRIRFDFTEEGGR